MIRFCTVLMALLILIGLSQRNLLPREVTISESIKADPGRALKIQRLTYVHDGETKHSFIDESGSPIEVYGELPSSTKTGRKGTLTVTRSSNSFNLVSWEQYPVVQEGFIDRVGLDSKGNAHGRVHANGAIRWVRFDERINQVDN